MRTAKPASRESTIDYEAAIGDIIERGVKAIRGTSMDDMVSDVRQKGRDAMRGARDVRDSFADAIVDSIRSRPYTTLAIAGFIGFAYGALRRK